MTSTSAKRAVRHVVLSSWHDLVSSDFTACAVLSRCWSALTLPCSCQPLSVLTTHQFDRVIYQTCVTLFGPHEEVEASFESLGTPGTLTKSVNYADLSEACGACSWKVCQLFKGLMWISTASVLSTLVLSLSISCTRCGHHLSVAHEHADLGLRVSSLTGPLLGFRCSSLRVALL